MPRLSKIGAAALAAFGWTSGGVVNVTASYLVVAGGGGGSYAGGGGAGGYRESTLVLNPTLSYTVTVGAGGAGETAYDGNSAKGSDSVFSTITSTGGGAGVSNYTGVVAKNSGGSGGGAGFGVSGSGSGNTPSTSPSQGNNGGTGDANNAGGGGGASAAGGNAGGGFSGNGGAGTASSISGSSVTRAGGGGGGCSANSNTNFGTGGAGGGGSSSTLTGNPGTFNTGGGGGAGSYNGSTFGNSGAGGSGVVIISYVGAQQFGGGVVTSSGGNTIHTFNTSGTLSPLSSLTANFLVIAGGGGGGAYNGGGGGAGGLRSSVTNTGGGGSLESSLTIDTNSIYTVTVGAGGSGQITSTQSVAGSNSSFLSIASIGGGKGGGYTGSFYSASTGGSGGGAPYAAGGSGAAGTANQGFAGGNGDGSISSGGGGGAGAVGSAGATNGGNGGAGVAVSISGTSVTYAGGGGGATYPGGGGGSGGTGGAGGGGNGGANSSGTAGTANLGGGGGGSQDTANPPNNPGGNGGSGVVIISYAGSTQLMAGGTVTVAGGNVIHTFTSSGYLTPIVLATNSLRFRSSASAYLNRTPTTASNRKTWTWSAWVKLGEIAASNGTIFSAGTASGVSSRFYLRYTGSQFQTGYGSFNLDTTVAVFRDPSAWYHIVLAVDTTQATASNRVKIYVNGVQQTVTTDANYTLNDDTAVNNTVSHQIASDQIIPGGYYDGYMADINFIDGLALTPNSFGTFNGLGVWQPVRYGGSYGTNGFYLPFTNKTSTTTLGYDFSPNGNNWTPNNISLGSTVTQTFTSSTTWVAPTGASSVTYLVVAGGGGAGGVINDASGGGGGGGYRTGTLSVTPGVTYTVTVGGGGTGGAGGAANNGTSGGDSVFSSITSTGGGYGGGGSGGGSGTNNGGNGGSGGGASNNPATGGTGTSGQGSNGGAPYGGGGGAGGAGTATAFNGANNGGAGLTFSGVNYAGGGCSGGSQGNTFGGGNGETGPGNANNTAGTTNRGGGGGGCWNSGNRAGANGGSGIVIISYADGASATNDSMTDVPTLTNATTANYATFNPLIPPPTSTVSATYSNGNLTATCSSAGSDSVCWATMGIPSSGLWYWEVTTSSQNTPAMVGIAENNGKRPVGGSDAAVRGVYSGGGQTSSVAYNGSLGTAYSPGFQNTTVGVALDMTNGAIYISVNGTYLNSGVPTSGASKTGAIFTDILSALPATGWIPSNYAYNGTVLNGNYGQRPFSYTPPTGFVALNTFNLPTPTIGATASTTANEYFDATTYTGNGGTQSVTNSGSMQPDFLWIKPRSTANVNVLSDSVRGTDANGYLFLASDLTNAESTFDTTWHNSFGKVTALNSNGFTVVDGSSSGNVNTSAVTYVAWQWRASNATAVTNTNGSIISSVSANTTSGFSIVTYTGNGANSTVGHGLGVVPSLYVVKRRNNADGWFVYSNQLAATQYLRLNLSNAAATFNFWQNTAPTSSVFYISTDVSVNASSDTYVAYCFAQVAGYSAFGSYTGNGSSDGTFVYTGFRPRFLLIKKTSVADWFIYDTARNTYNTMTKTLEPNTSNTERDNPTYPLYIDDLSNGFKCRVNDGSINDSGATYIYMAFAENPFKYANAR